MNDISYKTLLCKYNLAVASIQSLHDQVKILNQYGASIEQEYSILDSNARELCRTILSYDSNSSLEGTDATWLSMPTLELIPYAADIYLDNERKSEEMFETILDRTEDIAFRLDDVLARMFPSCQGGAPTPPNMTEGAVSGDEEYKPFSDLHKSVSGQSAAGQDPSPVTDETDSKDDLEPKVFTKGFKEVKNVMSDRMWVIIQIIGKEGLSTYADIKKRVHEITGRYDSQIRTTCHSMATLEVVDYATIKSPQFSWMSVCTLTPLGIRLFKHKFKKAPVESEASRIINGYGDLEQGYGVLEMRDVLLKRGIYKEVSVLEDREAISIGENDEYTPDLICTKSKKDKPVYMNYDRGNLTQDEFNARCNRFLVATKDIVIVAQNKTRFVKTLRIQIRRWIASQKPENFKDVTIRLSTIIHLREYGLDDLWLTTYDFNKSFKPIKDFYGQKILFKK